MEKVRPWCGQPSDRGRLKIRSEQTIYIHHSHDVDGDAYPTLITDAAMGKAIRTATSLLRPR